MCSSLLLAAALLGPALQATAQDIEAAQRAFLAAETAAGEERWADAERLFQEAFRLTGAMSAQVNAAVALRALGRYAEARDLLVSVLRRPEVEPAIRHQVEQLLGGIVPRIATIELVGLDARTRYTVRVDARRVDDSGERPLQVDVDPGSRTVEVGDHQRWQWAGELGAGEMRRMRVMLGSPRSLAAPVAIAVTGAVATAASALPYLLGAHNASQAESAPNHLEGQALSDRAERDRVLGHVVLALGASLLVVGVIWWVRRARSNPALESRDIAAVVW